MDPVDGADLHDVVIGALKIKGKAFEAVDADSSGIIDDGVVARICDIVGIGAHSIIPRVGPDNSEAGFDSPSHLYLVKDECRNNNSLGIRTYVQLNHVLPI